MVNRRLFESAQFILFIVVVVLLNLASNRLFFRFDLTEERIYTLSDISKDVVRTLVEPLSVRAFFTEDLPAPYNNVEQQLRDLLEEYAHENRGLFNYTFYTMGSEEDTPE